MTTKETTTLETDGFRITTATVTHEGTPEPWAFLYRLGFAGAAHFVGGWCAHAGLSESCRMAFGELDSLRRTVKREDVEALPLSGAARAILGLDR